MKTETKKLTSRDYTFGTFQDRLDHICLLFDTNALEIKFEDGASQPLLSDELMEWIEKHNLSMDWLFVGNPDGLLKRAAAQHRN
jgi:hypothetical protein